MHDYIAILLFKLYSHTMFKGEIKSVDSFQFLPNNSPENSGGGELKPHEKTALIIAVHGYGDSGVTAEGFLQSLKRYSTGFSGSIAGKTEGVNSTAFGRFRQTLHESHQKGRSGLLTNFAASLVIGLCNESDEPIKQIDVISPTLQRPPDLLPEGSTLFSGGVEGRAIELLGGILDWVDARKDTATQELDVSMPDEIIITGHSLGAPTVNTLFKLLETMSPDDNSVVKDRAESLAFVKAMLLGDFDNDYVANTQVPRLRVVPVDGAVDPHDALLLRQKMTDPENEDSIMRKRSIIFPLIKAINRGTVEQVTDTLQMDAPFHKRIGELLFKTPRLQRILSYTAHLPAVLHEAGSVVSAQATEDFATMIRLINRRDEELSDNSAPVLINHEDDLIFPAKTVLRLLTNAAYAIRYCSPEERLGKTVQETAKILSDVTGLGKTSKSSDPSGELSVYEKALKLLVAQRNLAAISVVTACKLMIADKLPQPDAKASQAGRFYMITMPGGSHTSIGGDKDAHNSSIALFNHSAGVRTEGSLANHFTVIANRAATSSTESASSIE